MPEKPATPTTPDQNAKRTGLTASAGLLVTLMIAVMAVPGIALRFYAHGDLNFLHAVFSLFFSTNLLICYWEACLFFRRDYIETRTEYWREKRRETGRSPALEFFATRIPLTQVLSPTIWADVWAAYCQYDASYADRRTYGFNVDIANGFVTPVPTLILYAAFTVEFLSPLIAGIVGVMLFWQWAYVTSLYWVSFFVAKRQALISRGEIYIFILAINSFWVLCALLGLYVSIRLLLDGNYSVLGY